MNVALMEVKVDGMTCSHCKLAVENAIAALPGVEGVEVDLELGKATIQGVVPEQSLIRTLQNEGYDARVIHAPTHTGR